MRGAFGAPDPTDDRADDAGRAILEVIFGAVLLLIPTIYLLITIFKFQAATFAVTQAARDVGRLVGQPQQAGGDVLTRAQRIADTALTDQQLSARDVVIRFTTPGGACEQGSTAIPPLTPGARYDVCVTAVVDLPGVPSVIGGDNNSVTGVYPLAIGEYREGNAG